MDNKVVEPIKIQYGGFKPRYYCPRCSRRIYKRDKICTYCLVKHKRVTKINWEGIK